MTAPAPASALIHAATLVTSGVVLLYHLSPSFTASVQDVLLFLGLLTSIWGSISALHAGNVKQVLASSTVSQLGLMSATLALGGGKLVLLFLVAHGFFKAGLFLSAGVLMKGNAEHTLNKEAFGGLFRTNKVFGVLFAIFLLSACGMPFFSGYYVKERILHLLVERGDFLAYFFMPLAFFLTSFYASVLYLKIFTGAEKGFISNEKTKKMLLPVGFLAFLSFWLFFGANPFGDFYEIYGLKPYSGNFGILAAGLLINLAGFSAGYFSLRAGIDFSRFIPDALSRSALFFNFCGANFFAASCAYCETSFKKLLFKHYQTRFSESDYEIFYEEKRVFFSTLLVRTAQKLSRADGVLTLSKDVIFEMAFILAYIGGKFDDAVLDGIVRFIYGAVGSGNRIFGRLQGRRAARYMLFALVSLVLLVLAIILASCRLV
jgi:NADH:ubiquinone oxidoreductase subunit 5 (subunit L)/multisubunit Na+/H+ antiporter MnhA subunit